MRIENLVVVVPLAIVASMFVAAVTVAAQDPAAVEAALSLDRPTRRLIQRALSNEGFDPGAPDGLFGPRTRAAIRAWQAARDEPQTGYLDGDQLATLRAAAVPQPMTDFAGRSDAGGRAGCGCTSATCCRVARGASPGAPPRRTSPGDSD